MKTAREYIKEIKINELNLKHISSTGIINASLLIDIEHAMKEYAKQCVHETVALSSRQDVPPANITFEMFNKIDNY